MNGLGHAARRRVAVVAAHPDDEVLGCGGTIARHVVAGDAVSVLIVAEGITSRFERRDRAEAAGEIAVLTGIAKTANAILGVTDLQLLDFQDNRMDQVDLLDVVKAIEAFLTRVEPNVVYTHFAHDLNVDHRIVSEAVQTASRPLPGSVLDTIVCFETASSTEWGMAPWPAGFVPNYFVDITTTQDLKFEALAAYAAEMRPWPHPRSIEGITHLARWRGATIGCDAAEAFMLVRSVLR